MIAIDDESARMGPCLTLWFVIFVIISDMTDYAMA